MSVDADLLPNETVLCRSTPHWSLFLPPLAVYAAATYFAVHLGVGALLLQIAATLAGLGVLFRRLATTLTLTNDRVIFRKGILRRTTEEIDFNKIGSIIVSRTPLGALFGYGSIHVRAIDGTWEPLACMSRPNEFKQSFYHEKAGASAPHLPEFVPAGADTPTSPGPAASVSAQLLEFQQRIEALIRANSEQNERAQSEFRARLQSLERAYRASLGHPGRPAD